MKLPDNPVVGYRELAEILGVSAGALYTRKNRSKLPLEPIAHIGLTAVFDRAEVLRYAEQRKASKSDQGKA